MTKIKYPVIVVPFLNVAGMAVFPFILVSHKQNVKDEALIRHETIHLKQELELLIIPFYIFYLVNYCVNRIIYKNHDQAYKQIYFEREAYANENKTGYLSERKIWAWRNYIKTTRLH